MTSEKPGPAAAAVNPRSSPAQGIVVVVDDNKDHRDLFCALFRMRKMTAVPAEGGREAEKILRQIHADLVVTDLNMPGLGGVELVEVLRRAADQHDLPIITISADSRYNDSLLAKYGAKFFAKSQFDEIVNAAEAVVAGKAPAALLPKVQQRFGA